MRILITGGAGFVGSSLARSFRERYPSSTVVALDNLRRRGSELNLASFRASGIEFQHGDIRHPGDLRDLEGNFDLMIEASAEPSVLAGLNGSPDYLLNSNLVGTLHCLEYARERVGNVIFLSTSRVYSIDPLRSIRLREGETRFEIREEQELPGIGPAGIRESFPVLQPRSLYGATKLASELIIHEYADSYGLSAVINRCGVIAGPGQFGKVDQGVFTLWVANHFFGKPLGYRGFGGSGKQVRDLLHPADLFDLIVRQLENVSQVRSKTFNIGGGVRVSTSLAELTSVCREIVGNQVPIASDPDTHSVDIPLYISDHAKATEQVGWEPRRTVRDIVTEIHAWLRANEAALRPIFC
jgi:CDP-paratose 2-epimerase